MSMTAASDPPFRNMVRQANKLLDQVQKGYFNFCPSETWTPSVNLYETETSYQVCVDLAGVDKDKIDLELTDNRLTLRGTRVVPSFEEGAQEPGQGEEASQGPAAAQGAGTGTAGGHGRRPRIHLMEIDHGAFSREVELPEDVDRERIAANYRNGLLWIEIPKS